MLKLVLTLSLVLIEEEVRQQMLYARIILILVLVVAIFVPLLIYMLRCMQIYPIYKI